jgi:hypothetical protein
VEEMGWRKEEQAEKAMRNFKAKGSMVPEQHRLGSIKTTERQGPRELSSDSSIEAFVDKGVQNAFTVAEKTVKDNLHPYAVSLLLSLSTIQLSTLQEKQLAKTSDKDPIYLCNQFLGSLDHI